MWGGQVVAAAAEVAVVKATNVECPHQTAKSAAPHLDRPPNQASTRHYHRSLHLFRLRSSLDDEDDIQIEAAYGAFHRSTLPRIFQYSDYLNHAHIHNYDLIYRDRYSLSYKYPFHLSDARLVSLLDLSHPNMTYAVISPSHHYPSPTPLYDYHIRYAYGLLTD